MRKRIIGKNCGGLINFRLNYAFFHIFYNVLLLYSANFSGMNYFF